MAFWSAFLLRRAGERFWVHIAGTAGIPIVVEASTNLEAGSWVALQSSTLTNGLIYFSDPQWGELFEPELPHPVALK